MECLAIIAEEEDSLPKHVKDKLAEKWACLPDDLYRDLYVLIESNSKRRIFSNRIGQYQTAVCLPPFI